MSGRELQNNIEFNFGRFIDDDGSIRPARDTGYRAPVTDRGEPEPFARLVINRAPDLPPLGIHNNDLIDRGTDPKYGVRRISIDTTAVRARRRDDIRRNVK